MSATPDSTLAHPEQRIADLERQLAECKAERDEALAERDEYKAERDQGLQRETATAEVLQVINSSPGDLSPVFDAILEKAHSLCGATYGGLMIRDGEGFRVVAAHGEPNFVKTWRETGPIPPREGSPLGRLIRGERVVHLADANADDSYRAAPPATQRLIDAGGIHTLLMVPLRKASELLGVITAFRQEVRPFTEKQIALLQSFAAQAVIAMENARLLTETREALEQQTATAEVLQVINSSPGDLAPVFDTMLEKAMRLCDAAFGILNTYDGETFHHAATRGVPPAYDEWRRRRTEVSGPGTGHARIIAGEDIVHSLDLMSERPYRDGDSYRRAFVELAGARTGLIVALRKERVLLGVIRIFRQEVRAFTDKQIALLQNFAAQAVIAMENVRLLGELRKQTSDLEVSLEYQTVTSEVLKVISRPDADLDTVMHTVLKAATSLCEGGTLIRCLPVTCQCGAVREQASDKP
jgi:GAF domain-containing protein